MSTDPASGETQAGTGPRTGALAAGIAAAIAAEIERRLAEPLAAGLHLVATPIGNLADVTLRALVVLAQADLVYCEDTRHSRTLLAHFGIDRPLRPYHEHNEDAERPRLLARLAEGRSIALISDAGTPLVSDPGFKLVREAIAAGHAVTVAPGASAVLPALVLSGLPSDRFQFVGFLPPREAARRARLAELADVAATLVLFEAPGRLAATLADVADVLGAERPVAVARELTKRFEDVRRGPAAELAAWAAGEAVRGEIVIVVGRGEAREASDAEIEAQLAPLLAATGLKEASRKVANSLGLARSRVYGIGLRLKGCDFEDDDR